MFLNGVMIFALIICALAICAKRWAYPWPPLPPRRMKKPRLKSSTNYLTALRRPAFCMGLTGLICIWPLRPKINLASKFSNLQAHGTDSPALCIVARAPKLKPWRRLCVRLGILPAITMVVWMPKIAASWKLAFNAKMG